MTTNDATTFYVAEIAAFLLCSVLMQRHELSQT